MSRDLQRRALLGALGAGTAAALAGCSSPFDDTHDVDFTVANDDERAYDLELFVLAADDGRVEVTFADGSTETHGISDLGPVVGEDPGRIAAVRPLEEPLDEVSFELGPGDETGGRFEDVPGGATVTGVATPPGGGPPLEGFGSMLCSPDTDVMEIEVRLTSEGMHSGVFCRSQ